MGSRLFLCADIGTSALKAAYIDGEGRSRGFVRATYTRERPGPVEAGDWEAAFSRALEALRREAGSLEVDALCISGNGPTLVPLTGAGEALSPLHWYRGGAASGGAIPQDRPSLFLPSAAAFLGEHPRDYERTRYFLSSQEWLSFRCGADPVTVLPAPAYEPYYWDDLQCAALHLDRGKFPPFAGLGSPIGEVSAAAAETFGLRRRLPIVAGGPDFVMALIGVGAVKPGIVCDRAGSSEGINLCSAVPFRAPELRTLPHVAQGLWNLGAILPSSGGSAPYERGSALYERGSAPPLGNYGTPFGGFPVREALDTFRRYGFPITEMRLSGGQAKNPRWNQFKADITGCTLLVPEIIDGELTGDACAAALALGEYGSLSQAASGMVRIGRIYRPHPRGGLT